MTDSVVSAAATDPDLQEHEAYLIRASQAIAQFKLYLIKHCLWNSWLSVDGAVVWQYLNHLYDNQVRVVAINEVLEHLHFFFRRLTFKHTSLRNPCTGMKWAPPGNPGQFIPLDAIQMWSEERVAAGYKRGEYGPVKVAL